MVVHVVAHAPGGEAQKRELADLDRQRGSLRVRYRLHEHEAPEAGRRRREAQRVEAQEAGFGAHVRGRALSSQDRDEAGDRTTAGVGGETQEPAGRRIGVADDAVGIGDQQRQMDGIEEPQVRPEGLGLGRSQERIGGSTGGYSVASFGSWSSSCSSSSVSILIRPWVSA